MKKILGIISAILGVVILFAWLLHIADGIPFLEAVVNVGLIAIGILAFIVWVCLTTWLLS